MTRLSTLATLATMGGTAVASSVDSSTGPSQLQLAVYVKRNPDFRTREDFWEYWQTQHAPKVVPLATHLNFSSYEQIHVGGKIAPTEAGAEEPVSNELLDFDGIALFVYDSPASLDAMIAHPYYIDVVEPDERKFIDKEAFNGGLIASHVGKHVGAVNMKQDVWVGDEETRVKYQKLFETYQ